MAATCKKKGLLFSSLSPCVFENPLNQIMVESPFLNSLIIHDKNTKEITTVKEAWLPSLSLHIF